MLQPGIYPAAVTPFDEKGKVDMLSVARLLAWFEAAGCVGAVLAGTNGEGPSLSPVEKRDLIHRAMPLRGKLDLILGIATSSSDEAIWLCKQAHAAQVKAVLLLAPYYFREATEEGVAAWFRSILDASPVPVLIYNFPQRTGVTITPDLMHQLSLHENFAGAKDSSGDSQNIAAYKQAVGQKLLFVGNETLLLDAIRNGWTGSISGVGNVLPMWLSQIVKEWLEGEVESAETKFELILPLIKQLRSHPQPSLNKALLARIGVLERADPRLPLSLTDPEIVDAASEAIRKTVGLRFSPELTVR
jgi:4-hydroxy-tetrahydrodipicolinate synthase